MTAALTLIPTDKDHVYAFEIHGEVASDDMNAMAETMNNAFDHHDKVDMLLLFKPYDGSETAAMFDAEVVKSRFRSLANVDKYVVVGASDRAQSLINFMDMLIPVTAITFDSHDEEKAWSTVNASPRKTAGATAPAQT